jgi:putative ABC transport system permease protein
LDGSVLAFTVLVTAAVTLLVGIAPALRATRVDPQRALVEGGRAGIGRRAHRTGEVLIVAEVALALVLVTGAGLLLRSFATLLDWDGGFEQRHLLTAWTFSSPGKFRTRAEVADLISRAETALRTIPSVTSVASGSSGPLFGGDGEMNFTIDGAPAPAGGPRQATRWADVSPGYFQTIGLPIVRGRGLEETDGLDRPLVGVVNEAFVRRYFTGDPIGHVIHMEEFRADFTIVGVVRDVPAVRPGDPVPPQIFWPNRQVPRTANYYLVRVAGDPRGVSAAIQARLFAIDPEMQVSTVQTVRDWLGVELVRPRFAAVLLGTFGALALGLAAVGVYGLFAYTVARRTREIGIRVALGAPPAGLVRSVVLHGLRLAAIAVALGLVASIGLTRLIAGLLAGVGATDPATLIGSVAVLLAAALIATVVPARRAARVDPLEALRAD